MSYPAIYRALATNVNGSVLDVFIPQVFGDVPVRVSDCVGALPTSKTSGWVMFQGGDPAYPVWVAGGVSVTTTPDSGSGIESARPATPAAGQRYFATDTQREWLYDGTGWIIMGEPVQTNTTACFSITGGSPTFLTQYHRYDGWCDVRSQMSLNATPTAIAGLTWTFPIPAASVNLDSLTVTLFDFSASAILKGMSFQGSTVINIYAAGVSGAFIGPSLLSLTSPFTWAANDKIHVTTRYQMNSRYS